MLNPKCPTHKGQKFSTSGMVLTVRSFYGVDGIEFDTYQEAREHNKSGYINVCNSEYGGTSHEKDCILII